MKAPVAVGAQPINVAKAPAATAPAKPPVTPAATAKPASAPAPASGVVILPPAAITPPAPAAKPAVTPRPAAPVSEPPVVVAPAAKPSLKAPATATSVPALQAAVPQAGSSTDAMAYRLRAGDPVIIYLRGMTGAGPEQQYEDVIDENGQITLPYINTVQAGGLTASELERTVRDTYLERQIYKYITVNVVVPSRSYYVRGEVRQPGRYPLSSGVTIVQAIAAAGGFTEFANSSSVDVLRGDKKFRVDVKDFEKHPERDKAVEAGDVIIINRSFW